MKNRSRVIIVTAVLLIGIAVWLPGLRPRRVAAQSPALMGTYGFTAVAPYAGSNSGTGALLGVITFDGAGNVSGTSTQVQPDPSPNATTVQTQAGQQFIGTYTVNANGTGAIAIPGERGGNVEIYTFVMTDGGSGFMFVLSAGGNYLLTGTARKQ